MVIFRSLNLHVIFTAPSAWRTAYGISIWCQQLALSCINYRYYRPGMLGDVIMEVPDVHRNGLVEEFLVISEIWLLVRGYLRCWLVSIP